MCDNACCQLCSDCEHGLVECTDQKHELLKWDPVAWLKLPYAGNPERKGRQDGPEYMRDDYNQRIIERYCDSIKQAQTKINFDERRPSASE